MDPFRAVAAAHASTSVYANYGGDGRRFGAAL
jgi:hypothetical protein